MITRRQPRSYQGRRALVTGGASGLGLELTRLLARDGAWVLVGDLHEERPDALPEGVEYRRLDVRSEEDWAAAREEVETSWGGLDLLVLNAGIAVGGRVELTSIEDWQRIIDINLLGVVRGFRAFVPMMKEAGGGQIVSTASLAGLVHPPAMAAYDAVKAGVVALTESARAELAPYSIDVQAICPSFFRTNLHTSLQGADQRMEQDATGLITRAPRSAAQVAARAYAGMQAGGQLILTDGEGRVALAAKRFARPGLEGVMRYAGRRIAAGRPPTPPLVERLQRLGSAGSAARPAAAVTGE